jgi:hypothetical protein
MSRAAPALLALVSACSFTIRPVTGQPTWGAAPTCEDSPVLPTLDTIAAVGLGFPAIGLIGWGGYDVVRGCRNDTDYPCGLPLYPGLILGAVATVYIIAAYGGWRKTSDCRALKQSSM